MFWKKKKELSDLDNNNSTIFLIIKARHVHYYIKLENQTA